jgi:hypothetical protein
VRSLELKSKRVLTTGMFNLVVKDPITIRTRRRFRSLTDTALGRTRLSSKPFKHIAKFAVLSTYEQSMLIRSTGFGWQIARPIERARYAAPGCRYTALQRTIRTGALETVKDLVLEVPRLPLTYRSALSPISSPVARAAYLRPSTT